MGVRWSDFKLKWKRFVTDTRWSLLMKPAPHVKGVEDILDVSYVPDGDKWHHLDVHYPSHVTGELPAVLYFHGGGWTTVDKTFFHHYCRSLAKAGYVVFNADYRLAPDYRYPAQLEDGLAAVQWIRKNAAQYHADASRLFLAGDSAGAHLAATLACLYTNPVYAKRLGYLDQTQGFRLAGTVLLCGAFDIQSAVRVKLPSVGKYIKGLLDIRSLKRIERTGFWVEMSPLLHVTPEFPPTFLTDAYADGLFPQSVAMEKVLDTNGVKHTALYLGGRDLALIHDYQVLYFLPVYKKSLNAVVAFLDEVAKGKQPQAEARADDLAAE